MLANARGGSGLLRPPRPDWFRGLILALLGVFASQAIHDHLAHDQQTEWATQCWRFTLFSLSRSQGSLRHSSVYGTLRRSLYPSVGITCVALTINIIGFFVPTGGYAMLPFYASTVVGVSLTMAFLGRERRDQTAGRTTLSGPMSEV